MCTLCAISRRAFMMRTSVASNANLRSVRTVSTTRRWSSTGTGMEKLRLGCLKAALNVNTSVLEMLGFLGVFWMMLSPFAQLNV